MIAYVVTLSSSVLRPSFWLVAGLAWSGDALSGAPSAIAIAPDALQVQLLRTPTRQVLDLARYFASHSQYRVVFLAELTRWLDHFGRTWSSDGIDFDQALYDITEVLPGLYLGLDHRSYCIVCEELSRPVDRVFQATSVSVDSPGSGGVMSTGRSSNLPLWKTAPARTRATRCGALTARQRACAASMSL